MTTDEKELLFQEMFGNTLDFLSHEMILQLKHKELSFSENMEILTNLLVGLLVNHIVNISQHSKEKKSPLDIFKSLNLEDNFKRFSDIGPCCDCSESKQ